MALAVVILFALGAAWLGWRAWQDNLASVQGRAMLLVDADTLLEDTVVTPLASGYRKVTGRYRDLPVQLEPIVDTLSVRKLPTLWLMVTIPAPVAVRATFDMMMRSNGLEVFSRFNELPDAVAAPDGFPEWAAIRSDDPAGLPDANIIKRYLGPFESGDGKELLISRKGVRIVLLAAEAGRSHYLIFRDARFGPQRVAAKRLRAILDDLIALRADLNGAQRGAHLA